MAARRAAAGGARHVAGRGPDAGDADRARHGPAQGDPWTADRDARTNPRSEAHLPGRGLKNGADQSGGACRRNDGGASLLSSCLKLTASGVFVNFRDASEFVISRSSTIEILAEFKRMRPQPQGLNLSLPFAGDPRLDGILAENIIVQQEFMIFFEGPQGFVERRRNLRPSTRGARLFAFAERRTRMELELNSVNGCQSQSGECQIGVATGVGEADLDSPALGTGIVSGNPARSGAVLLSVRQLARAID